MTIETKPRLILTVGLPGSGKSTWARQQVAADETGKTVRINRDDLRFMTFGKYVLDIPGEQEPLITAIQENAVRAALRSGVTVIVDDTNLNERFRRGWERLAQDEGAEYVLHVMNTPLEECIRRDQQRWETDGERLVGRDIIEAMAAAVAREERKRQQKNTK